MWYWLIVKPSCVFDGRCNEKNRKKIQIKEINRNKFKINK